MSGNGRGGRSGVGESAQRKPSRRELIEREGDAADRLCMQLGRFSTEAQQGRTDAAEASRLAYAFIEEAQASDTASRAKAFDGAAELLRNLADREGLDPYVPPPSRRELIEREGHAADAAHARWVAVEREIARFPVRAARGDFDRREAREFADNIIGKCGGRPEGWDEAGQQLRERADCEDRPPYQAPDDPKRVRMVGTVGEPDDSELWRLLRAAGNLMRPKRGAGVNAQAVLDLALVFMRMRADGIEPPRRYISRAHVARTDMWGALYRHRLLDDVAIPDALWPDGVTTEQRNVLRKEWNPDLVDWSAFRPSGEQLRKIERRAAHYFRQAHKLIEAAGLTAQARRKGDPPK